MTEQSWASTNAFLSDLLKLGIKPNAEAIAAIWADGDIAVLFWKTDQRPEETAFGFRGPVGRMPEAVRSRLRALDHVTQRWCDRTAGPHRLFVVSGSGTLLLNCDDGECSVEPDSTGTSWSN